MCYCIFLLGFLIVLFQNNTSLPPPPIYIFVTVNKMSIIFKTGLKSHCDTFSICFSCIEPAATADVHF